jgi:hypothetical protein
MMQRGGPGAETRRWQGVRPRPSRRYGDGSTTQPAGMDRRLDVVLHHGSGS